MSIVKYYTVVVLVLFSANHIVGNTKAYFPLSNQVSYPRLVIRDLPTLNEFTFCSWIRPFRLDVEYPYIFSYATTRSHNELSILLQRAGDAILGYVQIGEPFVSFRCPHIDWRVETWQHICASWLGTNGTTRFFANGQPCSANENERIASGGSIFGDGVAVLGQDQDAVNGQFDPDQAWYGDLANVNLWNEVLSVNEIWEAGECNGNSKPGTVIAWMKTIMSGYDGVVITETNHCL